MVQHGLLDAIADGLLVCDSAGTIVALNRRIVEISGHRASDLIGQSVELLVPASSRDQHERHRAGFARSGSPTRPMGTGQDTRLLTKGGSTVPVDIALSPLTIDSRSFVVAAIRDATARIRKEQSLLAVTAVTDAILKGWPARDIHLLVCEQAVEFANASLAFVAVRDEDGVDYVVEAAAGPGGTGLQGLVLRDRFWDGANEIETRRIVAGTFKHLRQSVDRPLGPIAVFPLPEGQRLGFLVIAREGDQPAIGEESLDALDTFASQAGLAFAYGRRLRALAVAGDRDRIARDLHDLIIQRLFGAGLSLQVAAQIFGDPDLSHRLQEVMASLDAAIAELRRSIFDLERKDRPGFAERVRTAVEEVLADQQIESRVRVEDASPPPHEDKVAHLLATLREALTNTRRHASASNVEVTVAIGTDLILRVRDDGTGIRDDAVMGHGLSNMAKRAWQLGGDLEVTNSCRGGLQLEWRVPL